MEKTEAKVLVEMSLAPIVSLASRSISCTANHGLQSFG